MRGIYLPTFNVGFIFTHKSGSRLLSTTLFYFLEMLKIPCEFIPFSQFSNFTEKNKKTKFYIMTRNPIDRFISGYSWLKKNQKNQFDEYLETFKLDTIVKYVENYVEMCSRLPDSHFLPQTYGILSINYKEENFTYFENLNYRKEFDKIFYHYKIIHIEDVHKKHLEDIDKSLHSFVKESNDTIFTYHGSIIDLFDEFVDIPYTDKVKFNLCYEYANNMLEKNHHIHEQFKLSEELVNKIKTILGKEMMFLGYDS